MMAAMMYDSLHEKLKKLPDGVEVYPAHGAGSMCGKNLSKETSSTIGQRESSTTHFSRCRKMNSCDDDNRFAGRAGLLCERCRDQSRGRVNVGELPRLQPMTAEELRRLLRKITVRVTSCWMCARLATLVPGMCLVRSMWGWRSVCDLGGFDFDGGTASYRGRVAWKGSRGANAAGPEAWKM